MNKSKKLFNGQQKAKQRRENVILRLETQLKSGFKPNKDKECAIGDLALPLEEQDVKRIKSELQTLKSRV